MIPEDWGATGPGVRKPASGLFSAMAHSVGLGLAFPRWGLRFLTCHGSRLGCIGKHQQECPWERADGIWICHGVW